MAAYVGQIVTLTLLNNGGQFCGKLVARDYKTGRITLTKVTCLTTNKKLPGNQTYYVNEIVPDSIVITAPEGGSSSISSKDLKVKPSKTLEERGSKRLSSNLPIKCHVQKETYDLASIHEHLQQGEDPTAIPKNVVTANIYKKLEKLSSKESWLQRKACVRPSQYIVIDKLGEEFDEAMFRINSETTLGVAVTGINIGRHGTPCWIQVGTSDVVYLFDAFTMGHSCITYGLDKVFSSTTILKVIHDCRWISDMLFHQYRIKLVNVFDTQASAILAYRVLNGGDIPAYVDSLQNLVEKHLTIYPNEYHAYKVRQVFKEEEEKIWSSRPMNDYLLDCLAKTASYLNELRTPLLNIIMHDFYLAVDYYVSCVRDLPKETYEDSARERHTVPKVFSNMVYRDKRKTYGQRFKNNEDRVDSTTGFVECVIDVADFSYRKDSIFHGFADRQPEQPKPSKPKRQIHQYVVPAHVANVVPKSTPSTGNSSSTEPPTTQTTCTAMSSTPATIPATTIQSADSDKSYHSTDNDISQKLSTSSARQDEICSVSGSAKNISLVDSEWTPAADLPTHKSPADGLPATLRKQVVGRGKRLTRGHASDEELFVPRKTVNKKSSALSSLRSSEAAHDSDSGVDSGSPAHRPLQSTGVISGFQNLELMGAGQTHIGEIPDDFDVRSTSIRELVLHRERKEEIPSSAMPSHSPVEPGVQVLQHLHRSDGTVENLDTGTILSSSQPTAISCSDSDLEQWDE